MCRIIPAIAEYCIPGTSCIKRQAIAHGLQQRKTGNDLEIQNPSDLVANCITNSYPEKQ